MSVSASQLVAEVRVDGADKAKSDLSGVGKFVNDVGSMFKSGLGGALSFATDMAGKGLQFLGSQLEDSIKLAMNHQAVFAQTAQAIKSTGDASGMTATGIQGLAESMSKVTPFSQDMTESGENLLLTFTGIGKKTFPEATQTMLDMAQAMHTGPTQEAMLLGKALNDPATGLSALTRVGVTFSAQEKEQIKTMMAHNDVAGAQAVMLKELQTEFGGSAVAAGKTFGGALQILTNNLDDVKIKIGTALLPILNQLMSFVSSTAMPVIAQFARWLGTALPQAFKAVQGAITYVWDVLRALDLSDFIDAFHTISFEVEYLGRKFGELLQAINPFKGAVGDFDPLADAIDGLAGGALKIVTDLMWDFSEAFVLFDKNSGSGSGIISALSGAIATLGSILSGILPTIDTVVVGIGNFIMWLSKGGIWVDTFKAALIGIGVAFAAIQIGSFIATIPALVTGFLVWAGAAWTAAAGTIAATWPLIAIGAAIALVVAGIVIAVQHWGDITKFLQGAWQNTVSWFHTALADVGNFFSSTWQSIQSKTSQFTAFLGSLIQSGMKAVYDFFMAPINLMVQGIQWLYEHNTYVHMMVDAITQDITRLASWLSSTWTTIKDAVMAAFAYVYNGAVMYWRLIASTIQTWTTAAYNFLKGTWDQISGYISGQAQLVWGVVVRMWQQISGVFSSAWTTYIAGPLGSIWTSIMSTVNGWGGQAEQSGSNLISMLAQGIMNGVGVVGNAVKNVASTIWANLGFHSPTKEGPGSTAHLWAPAFIQMYTQGLLDGLPQVQAAANALAATMQIGIGATTVGGSTSAANSASSLASKLTHGASASSTHHHSGHSTHHSAHSTHHHTGTSTHHHAASTHNYAGLGTALASAFTQQPIKVEVTLASAHQPLLLTLNNQQFGRVVMPLIVDKIRQGTGAKI